MRGSGAYTINRGTFAASSAETIMVPVCLLCLVYLFRGTTRLKLQMESAQSIYAGGERNWAGRIMPWITGQRPNLGIYMALSNVLGFFLLSMDSPCWYYRQTQPLAIGGAGTPNIASGACGTGTNGTIAANGNDQAFEVLIGSAATTTCTITFASAFGTAPGEVKPTLGRPCRFGGGNDAGLR